MIRNIAASWLFAAFLVVVAVVTWRVLDSGRPSCPAHQHASCPHAAAFAAPIPNPEPEPIPEPAHTCGAGGAAFDDPPASEPVEPVEPAPAPHTCGAG
ncbi:MAG TPA: hypothetical protein VGO62_17525 [Myxococcota bacterium]